MTGDICPIERVVKLLGSKWTLLIIRDLMNGCRRFGQLQKSIGGINPRTLSQRLSALETAGLVIRRAYAEIPPRVEYALTEKGRALSPLLDAMREYGEKWLATPSD
ncbi:MAG: winged helix-turn-helix transcriptional regulator [Anaerolineae bacterium]